MMTAPARGRAQVSLVQKGIRKRTSIVVRLSLLGTVVRINARARTVMVPVDQLAQRRLVRDARRVTLGSRFSDKRARNHATATNTKAHAQQTDVIGMKDGYGMAFAARRH